MELTTAKFGNVSFEPHEVLVFDRGVEGFPNCRHWVLLADQSHPSLLWLQSVTDPHVSVPVACSPVLSERVDWEDVSDVVDELAASDRTAMIVLAMLGWDDDRLIVDRASILFVCPQSNRGVQVRWDSDQTLQYAPSEQMAPLRKCA